VDSQTQVMIIDLAPVRTCIIPELTFRENYLSMLLTKKLRDAAGDFNVTAELQRRQGGGRSRTTTTAASITSITIVVVGRPLFSVLEEVAYLFVAHEPLLARSLKSTSSGGLTMRTLRPSACQRRAAD